jgi:dolichyl-phosphate-mannose-protein mannosyltransferase
MFFLHLFVTFALGFFLTDQILGTRKEHILYRLAMGWGIGSGLASLTALSCLVLLHSWNRWVLVIEILFLIWIVVLNRKAYRVKHGKMHSMDRAEIQLAIVALLLLVVTTILFVLLIYVTPHGRWDSWMIWNLRARALFRSPSELSAVFSPLIFNADYPLLLPLNIALGWAMSLKETLVVPAVVALLFTFAPMGLLTGYFFSVGSRVKGLVAAMILMGTPLFIFIGADQIADTPISFYFLATIVLLHRSDYVSSGQHRLLLMAGLMAGLSAWTKNEGLLFILAVLLARILVPGQSVRTFLRTMTWFTIGLLPVLCVLIWFKLNLAPASNLWADRSLADMLGKLTDISRYIEVGLAYGRVLYGFNYWPALNLNFILLFYAFFIGFSWHKITGELRWACMVLLLMFSGYFFTFILTPHGLTWHLNTAAERLFLQFYPCGLFLYFLMIPGKSDNTSSLISYYNHLKSKYIS